MAFTPIRSVPSNLPHARIYLDDLADIEGLLAEAAFSARSEADAPRFRYEVDGKRTFETIKDLEEYGGHTFDFRMVMISPADYACPRTVLTIRESSEPELGRIGTSDPHSWELYGKINQMFVARQDQLKRIADLFPWWSTFVLWAFVYFLEFLPKSASKATWNVMGICVAGLLLAYAVLGYGKFRRNRVYFRYSRQDEKSRSEVRRDRFEKFLWVTVGSAVTLASQWIATRLKH